MTVHTVPDDKCDQCDIEKAEVMIHVVPYRHVQTYTCTSRILYSAKILKLTILPIPGPVQIVL